MGLISWYKQLAKNFSSSFLFLVITIYWTQGFRAFPWTGISYLIKDEFRLSPSASQLLTSTAFIPWSIKPVYGIITDCVYIRGARRVPYLIIASGLSTLAWLAMAIFPVAASTATTFTMLLTCQNLGAALADVVVDALVAETAKHEKTEYAGDLQSLSWFSMALGGVFGSLLGGPGLSALKPYKMFGLFSLFPLVQFIVCCFLDEHKLGDSSDERRAAAQNGNKEAKSERGVGPLKGTVGDIGEPDCQLQTERAISQVVKSERSDTISHEVEVEGNDTGSSNPNNCEALRDSDAEMLVRHKLPFDGSMLEYTDEEKKYIDAPLEGDVTYDMNGACISCIPSARIGGEVTWQGLQRRRTHCEVKHTHECDKPHKGQVPNVRERHAVWQEFRRTGNELYVAVREPAILRPLIWFTFSCACIPSLGTMMFYYHTNHLHLDPAFLGSSRVVGWVGLMAGTVLYRTRFKQVALRVIFMWVHIGLAVITAADTMLVSRMTERIGISDKLFVMGTSAIIDAVNQFKFMPFLILSARLCPPGIEGTLFSLFMSAYNLGGTLGGYFGASLAAFLGITSPEFKNLTAGIWVQAACTLLPIPLLFMVPENATGAAEDVTSKYLDLDAKDSELLRKEQ